MGLMKSMRNVFAAAALFVSGSFAANVISWVPSYFIDKCLDASGSGTLTQDFGGVKMSDGLTHLALQFWAPNPSTGAIYYIANGSRTATSEDVKRFNDWGNRPDVNVKVMLCVYNNDGTWNWNLVAPIIRNTSLRATFVSNLVKTMEDLQLDGVEVDLENGSGGESDAGDFNKFISELNTAVKAKGKEVTVASFHYIWNMPNQNMWSEMFPNTAGISSMGYNDISASGSDYHAYSYQKSAAGSNSSKLMLGMPTYAGGSWLGSTVQQNVDWAKNNGVGVGIWDASLGDGNGNANSAWRTAAVWNSLKAIKNANAPAVQYTVTPSVVNGNGTVSPSAPVKVNSGGGTSFTFTANTGYQLSDIKVNGVSKTFTGTSYTVSGVVANTTVDGYFTAREKFNVTAQVNGSGTVSPSTVQSVYKGDPITYTLTPASGCRIDSVKVNGTAGTVSGSSYTISAVNSNTTFAVWFGKIPVVYSITASSAGTGSGQITPSGTASADENKDKVYTFTPSAGSRVDSVYVDNIKTAVTGNSYTFPSVTANHTIKVWFNKIPSYTITASSVGVGGGSGYISNAGSVTVLEGGSKQYTFTSYTGSRLDSVKVDGKITPVVNNSYTFENVVSAHSITAYFGVIPAVSYKITSSVSANGTVSPSGSLTVSEGGSQLFTYTPSTGYRLDSVKVDGKKVVISNSSYSLTNITADHTVEGFFGEAPKVTVTASAVGGGTVSPSGATSVFYGDKLQFTFTANAGQRLDSVKIDGVKTTVSGSSYTLMNITSNRAVTAYFGVNNSGIDTLNPSSNLLEWGNWTAHSDEFGSTADTGSAIVVGGKASVDFSLVVSDAAAEKWAWADLAVELPAGPKNTLKGVDYIKVTYKATDSVSLLLNQDNLPEEGSSYRSTLKGTNGIYKTVLLKVSSFTQPDWVAAPGALDLSVVKTISFLLDGSEEVKREEQFEVSELILYRYAGLESALTFAITAKASEGVAMTPTGSVNAVYMEDQDFIYDAVPGYVIDSVKVDGKVVKDTGSYTFTAVTAAHTISVFASKESSVPVLMPKNVSQKFAAVRNSVWSIGAELPELVLALPSSFAGANAEVSLYDPVGNRLLQLEKTVGSGTDRIVIPVDTVYLGSGFYLLTVKVTAKNGETLAEKRMIGIQK